MIGFKSLFLGAAIAQMNPEVTKTLENADWSNVLRVKQPSGAWTPSKVYKPADLIAAVTKMTDKGIGEYKLLGGLSDAEGHYALVNLAGMIAQSMQETIQYDACDENNWDQTSNYSAANACGQLGQSYQDYKCKADEAHMACEVDPNMELIASTQASWSGAPGPMFCAPKSKVAKAPRWDTAHGWCDPKVDHPHLTGDKFFAAANSPDKQVCGVYEGQKGGEWASCNGGACPNNAAPKFDQPARSDVEGCCWWGRGVIQTTGVCNFGKLNYYAGARAKKEGRDALFPDIDFCKRPDHICNSTEHPDLKWVAGFFFYVKEIQDYPTDDKYHFDYKAELKAFTDAGNINDATLINKISGIVNRGCPALSCPTGQVDKASIRAANFRTVLQAFGFPFKATTAATEAPVETTQAPTTSNVLV